MAKFIRVKNFEEYQHYTDRNPPWIKLHRRLFEDYEFSCLQDASKLHLVLIWLLASQLNNKIPYDAAWIKTRIGIRGEIDLNVLIQKGFLLVEQNDSDALADCQQNGVTEAEAYKTTDKEKRERKAASQPLAARKHSKGTSWPSGFSLTPERRRYAQDHGITNPEDVWECFQNHHQAKGSIFKDWAKAWRTWVLREKRQFGKPRHARSGGQKLGTAEELLA